MSELTKYIIICPEGTEFGSWANKGATEQEIIDHFFELGRIEEFETDYKDYNLDYIRDIWNVIIKKIEE